jgi:hypothetical protein
MVTAETWNEVRFRIPAEWKRKPDRFSEALFGLKSRWTMKQTRDLADGYKNNAKACLAYGAAIKEFSDTIWALFSVECQDCLFSVSPMCELFERLAAAHQAFGTSQLRVADDIRDIAERHAVLARATPEHKSALRAVADAKAKLQKCENEILVASHRPDFNKGKADLLIKRLRREKREALFRARDRTAALIEEQRKFARFKFRRTQHAFIKLGTALVVAGVREARIVTRLVEAIQKARSEKPLIDATIEEIELVLKSGVVIAAGRPLIAQILTQTASAQGSERQKEAIDQVVERRLASEPEDVAEAVLNGDSAGAESEKQSPEPPAPDLVPAETAVPTDEQFPESVAELAAGKRIHEPAAREQSPEAAGDEQSPEPAVGEQPTEPAADKGATEQAPDDQVAWPPEEG